MWLDKPSPLESHNLLAAPLSHRGHNTEQHESTDDTKTQMTPKQVRARKKTTEKGTKGLSNMGCGTHLCSLWPKLKKLFTPWMMNHTCMRLQGSDQKRSFTRTRLCWQKSAWQLCLTCESLQRSCVSKKQPSNSRCTQMSGSAQNRRTSPFL